ncbi:MAG TPA: hypothetical protein VGM39_09315 [Kofleriaceae bacterium]|jgi:hypothetical protein
MIRYLLLLSACSTTAAPPTDATASSVRERLASPTRLMVSAQASSGSIVAGHYVDGAWSTATVPLTIENGAVSAKLDDSGGIAVTELGLGFAPLTLPLDTSPQLTNIRLDLGAPIDATTTWTNEDNAAATASISLALSWALLVGGTATPLSDETFSAVPIQLVLDGDGATVDGEVTVSAKGTLWSWADLVELDDLSLTLTAATLD